MQTQAATVVGGGLALRIWSGGPARARLVVVPSLRGDVAVAPHEDVTLGRIELHAGEPRFLMMGRGASVEFVEEADAYPVRWWNKNAVSLAFEPEATHVALVRGSSPIFIGPLQARTSMSREHPGVRFGPSWLTLHLEDRPHRFR